MIYLSISVKNVSKTSEFYTSVLGIFKSVSSSRVVCKSGLDLIIDFYQIGTESHKNIFGTLDYVPSCFALHHGEGVKVQIKDKLQSNLVDYEITENVAGEFLKFHDPNGHRLSIWGYHGNIV